MKKQIIRVILALSALTVSTTRAQSIYEPYAFTTPAGLALNSGTNDGTGSLARFYQPWGLAVDGVGNIYVADTLNQTIRKMSPAGVVTTLAGVVGSPGFNDGTANVALFSRPTSVAVNSAGTVVYVADRNNHLIRQLSGGVVTTLAGSAGVFGSADGIGSAAQFHYPSAVAVDGADNVYVADTFNRTIRKITFGGVVATLAGSVGVIGSADGTGSAAQFGSPAGIAVDDGGNVYVADSLNCTVRKITSGGVVSTLAGLAGRSGFTDGVGSAARFSAVSPVGPSGVSGVAADNCGNVYVTDLGNQTLRKITPGGSVTTLGGWVQTAGSVDDTGSAARFDNPAGVAVDGAGNVYVADTFNHTLRLGVNTDTNAPANCGTNASNCPEGAPLDATGNLVVPDGMDTNLITYVEVNRRLGTVADLNPGFDTSVDLWYTNLTCLQSIGGTVPTNASSPDFTNLLAGIGITNVAPVEIVLTYSNWNVQIASQAVSATLSFPTAGPVGPPYFPSTTPHCPDPAKKYAFGGRDIVFVHGLQLGHVFAKIAGNLPASQNWATPTQFPGSFQNPEFYGAGYFKAVAERVWAGHIQKFLTANGYQNRYLIVDYPCTERLEIGAQAVLTQISDAMHFGTGVKDLDPNGNHDTSNFGTPSFVVVSHSTGTILTDVAMAAAAQYPNLGAYYIPQMCKAHVAMDGVFSGSEEATAAVAISGFANCSVASWACQMANVTLALFEPSEPPLDCNFFQVFASSVMVDLVPLVAQHKWGTFVDQTPVRTLLLVGGHPSYLAPIKNLIQPGFDDGVTTINSQVANPNGRFLWPSGYRPQGSGLVGPFDMGLAGTGNGEQSGLMSPNRAVGYYVDQVAEPLRLLPAPLLIAGGATPYLSPSGMRQDVADAYDNTHFSTLNRYHNHFSFIQSATDHLVGYTHVDTNAVDHLYRFTGDEPNYEESRVITDPAVYAPFPMVYPGDDAPLLDRTCVPKTETWERGRYIPPIRFSLFGHHFTWGPWWIWRRVYDLLEGWETKMACDYMYESVLHCPPLKPCSDCQAQPSGLALWLPFDEAAGSATRNYGANYDGLLYDGSLVASSSNGPVHLVTDPTHTTPISGFNGGALYFDGLDDSVVVPSYNGINVGTGDFTLGAWVNRDSSSGASSTRIIIDKRAVTGIGYSFAVSSGSLLLQMTSIAGNPANHLDTNSVPLDNRWHFVTVTVARSLTNSVVRFFLDGTPTAILNTSVPPGSLDNTMPLRVGSSIFPGMDPWMGGMDEVVVFARALTAQEIQAIAGAGSVGQCKTPCAVPIFVQGATNKVVNCGTDWKFDLPTATSCCSVGVQIVSAGLATNGICPKTITQSWLITDDCGNSTTCSQTVTLRATQPPTLVCAKNTIIVALNVGCQLEIPTIQPPATDNCTPASQLVYSQTPSAGAILPGPCQIVTVTVMDACKNVSQCQVLVCGQDQTPPTLHYPKFVTVTNCLVPDVLAQVSAADNCTASRQLVFSQLPSAGTPIAAGGNLVAVNVTDLAGNMTSVVVPLVASGLQSFLDVLFDTGVDSNRVVLGTGAIDPHYTLGPVPIGSPTGPGAYNAPNAVVVSAGWGWPLSPFTSSGWIAPELPYSDTYTAAGSYTYTNLFVLPPGADPLTASVSGRWAADGSANMYLNGLAAANGAGSPITAPGYDHWTPFTVNSGFLAFPAVNRLYFVVTNGQGYGDGSKFPALRVEITAAVANCSACTPPVILHQTLNQSLPLNSTAVFSVSMWGTPPFTFQWYHNGLALANGGRYSGVNTPTLTLTPLSYADAGSYYTAVSNSCGQTASAPVKLTVGRGWGPWPWAWWDFALIGSPMRATVGPDLIMEGTNTLGISSGTTIDFGLPNLGGKIANVMDVLPLPSNTFIRLPYLGSDSNVTSYTLIMDVCVPSNSDARATFFTIFDRWGNMMDLGITPGAAGEVLSLQGTVGGATFSLVYPPALSRGASPAWNRIALVVENTAEPGMGDQAQGMLTTYLNGKPAGIKSFAAPAGSLASDLASMVTIMSSPVMGTKRESFVSSLQFHAVAFTPEMLAGIGSPDNGPLRANDTSVGLCPALSATTSNGVVNLSWTGSAFLLQETSDVRHGAWIDSTLPFDEAEVNGEITTTAHANPAMEGQEKFYRLTYVP